MAMESKTSTPRYSGSYNCSLSGDEGVGKTSLAVTKAAKEFPPETVPTVFENYAADATVGCQKYLLGLFDTASDYCYEPLRAFAYEKSDVFLLCYSVVKRESFNNLKTQWIPELRRYVSKKKPMLLVGLKADQRQLTHPSQCVSCDEGRQLAHEIGAVNHLECSALSRVGMNELFDEVLRLMISSKKKKKTFGIFRSLGHQMRTVRSNTSKAVNRLLVTKRGKSEKQRTPRKAR